MIRFIFIGDRKVRQYFDMDIINQRLACKGEMVVLPKHYGTLNSEYMKNENLAKKMKTCKNFQQVKYMHFSGAGKPWSHLGKRLPTYLDKYENDAKPLVKKWFEIANETCHGLLI